MSGFSGIVILNNELKPALDSFEFPTLLQGAYNFEKAERGDNYHLNWYSNGKFLDDKFLKKNQDKIIGFDGINLQNGKIDGAKIPLEREFNIEEVRGAFSALAFSITTNRIKLTADHTSSRQIFYYWSEDFYAFSSSIFLLKDILKKLGKSISLFEPAAYMLLSLGYLLEDYTLIKEIKKVKAGEHVILDADGSKAKVYHNYYENVEYKNITTELLEELNKRFKYSLASEYQKDRDHHKDHISTLSGGLDSRLNLMLAYKYGFNEITALTFSEGFKSDELTARKITKDLSIEHIVLLLNSGKFLMDIETPLRLNNCAVYYFGAAQTYTAVRKINFDNFGLLHHGGLAESSKGGYLNGNDFDVPKLDRRYAVSDRYFNQIGTQLVQDVLRRYSTNEMFVTYNRGFNAIHNGNWMSLPFTDSVYTYMDTEFARLAYSIHPKLRFGGRLTIDWINELNPKLGDYEWKYGMQPTYNSRKILLGKIKSKIKRTFLQKKDISIPILEWYQNNKKLRSFIDQTDEHSEVKSFLSMELKKNVDLLLKSGTVYEKLLAKSFLKSVEMIFLDA